MPDNWEIVDKEILENRLRELGMNHYQLTKVFTQIRSAKSGIEETDPRRYWGTVSKAMKKPEKSSIETIEALIQALDGKLVIVWNKREQVLVKQEFVDMQGNLLEE